MLIDSNVLCRKELNIYENFSTRFSGMGDAEPFAASKGWCQDPEIIVFSTTHFLTSGIEYTPKRQIELCIVSLAIICLL